MPALNRGPRTPKGWVSARRAAALCGVNHETFRRYEKDVPFIVIPIQRGKRSFLWYRVGSVLRLRETLRNLRQRGGRPGWRPDSRKRVRRLHKVGTGASEIANILGMTRANVYYHLAVIDPSGRDR